MKRLIMSYFLLAAMVTLSAQTKHKSEFTPNFYLGLYGGLNALVGENNTPTLTPNTFSFTNNVRWGSALALGYDFTSVFGIRGEIGYAQNKWFNFLQNRVDKFWFESLTADLMFNMSNLFWGYNPQRRVDVQLFAGGGIGNTDYISNVRGDLITGVVRGGIQGIYHLNNNLDLNLELAANGVNDNYNSLKGGMPFDVVSSLMAGVAYHFKAKAEVAPAPVPEPVPEPVPAPKPVPTPQPVPAPAPEPPKVVEQPKPVEKPVVKAEVAKKIKLTAQKIFFVTGKADLKPESKTQLMQIVKIMNEDKAIQLAINGYTDNTGNADNNQKLSENRAATVKNFLVSQGISAARLQSKGFGINNPVATNATPEGRQQNRRVELIPSY